MSRFLVLGLVLLGSVALAQDWQAQQSKWEPTGLSGGGGLFNPAVSPHDEKMLLTESDMGGRYLSRDGGKEWRMYHYLNISASCRGGPVLFHPTRKDVLYATSQHTANTINVSTDGGKSFQRWPDERQPKLGQEVVRRMFIDPLVPDRLFLGTADGKVLYTDDAGKAWQRAEGISGSVIKFVSLHGSPKEARAYVVGTSSGVFASADGGKSFKAIGQGLPEGRPIRGFAGGSNEKLTLLYVATATRAEGDKLQGGVYVSKDKGQSFQPCMNPDINVQTKRSSPWAGDIATYGQIVANDVKPERAYVWSGGTSYFPPNHNTVYRTDDAGGKWTAVWFVDPRFKECNVAKDYITNYMHQSWVGGPISMEISPTDPDMAMRTDGMFMFTTRDAGKSWSADYTQRASDAEKDKDVTWQCNGLVNTTTWNYYVDPHEPNRHYICYTDIGFARSLDAGKTWRWWGPGERPADEEKDIFPIPRAWINTTYELAFDPAVKGKFWGAFSGHHDIPNENSIWRGTGRSSAKGGVAVTGDFGATFKTCMNGLPEAPALSIILDPKSAADSRTLYAAIYDHGVYKSTDGGASWTLKSAGLGDPANMRVCRVQLHKDGTLFALVTGMRVPANGPFTEKGVGLYRSSDAAESWQKVNKDYSLVFPKDFGVDPADSKVIFVGACDGPPPPRSTAGPADAGPQVGQPRQGGLHVTRDGGASWELAMRKRGTHFGVYFHPRKPGWVYATSTGWTDSPEGTLWLSKDGGKTWATMWGIPFAQTQRVTVDPKEDVIYVTTFGGSVWKGPQE